MTRTRMLSLGTAMLLALAGCGGADEEAADQGTAGGDTESSSDASSDGGSPAEGGSSSDDGGAGVDQDGFVTVEGTTYAFTYDNLGRCGADGGNGSIVSFGNLIDDSTRQVTFTYGLAEETTTGEAIMQVIVMGEGGATQLYYSAVGFGSDRGSVDTITRDGNTVRITGQLERVADQALVDFEAEATCDQ